MLFFLTFVPSINRNMQKLKKLSTFLVLTILACLGALMEGWLQTIAYNSPLVHGMTLKLCHYVRSKISGKVAKFHCDIYSWSKVMQKKWKEGALRAPSQG